MEMTVAARMASDRFLFRPQPTSEPSQRQARCLNTATDLGVRPCGQREELLMQQKELACRWRCLPSLTRDQKRYYRTQSRAGLLA